MIYCMSDIHGEYQRYLAMLEKIQFSDADTLYILGDVIDRGHDGVEVLLDIMERPNVHMILGNHEHMCLATLGPNSEIGARHIWQQNGGGVTRSSLLYGRGKPYRGKILRFLFGLPEYLDLTVQGRAFHLVHGYPGESQHTRIWGRPKAGGTAPIAGTTVIVGHTPTVFLHGDDGNPHRIWYGDGIIDIDCGCGHKEELRRLACLRLDDMAEFYV